MPITKPTAQSRTHLAASYGKLPLSFEANQGQTHREVKFLSRASGYSLFLTANQAVVALRSRQSGTHSGVSRQATPTSDEFSSSLIATPNSLPRFLASLTPIPESPAPISPVTSGDEPAIPSVLRMKLVGANPSARVVGLDELPGKSNYFIGNDPKKWRTNVPNYAKVKYEGVYPGVDLVYYGNQGGQLEYDFVVAPGADPKAITLDVGTPQTAPLRLDANGDLMLRGGGGDVCFHKPVVYQQDAEGRRHYIEGGYSLAASESNTENPNSRISFELASYDRTKPLIVDPVLSYSTYVTGSGNDAGSGIAVDASGNAYVTGNTSSTDFPTVNPIHTTLDGNSNAFVIKLNASGSALVYSTYLGGSGDDGGARIAIDYSGNAYVTGTTSSADFPTVNPFQASLNGPQNAFVSKLNAAGSALLYSTYLGGSSSDNGSAIAVDSSGNSYLTGTASSSDFPTVNPIQASLNGPKNVFVSKLNAAGSSLVYSTYLGGSGYAFYGDSGSAIAIDSSGNAYVTGNTCSTDFPTVNPIQAFLAACSNVFVTKLNAAGSALAYSTYLGGSIDDAGSSIAVDSSGNAYVTGFTVSPNFPTVNPIQVTSGYPNSATFITKLNAAGSALVYSTYLGGAGATYGNGIAVDSSGNAYVGGYTASGTFPTVSPIQAANASYSGCCDVFVTKLNSAGTALTYSTYLGGSGYDFGLGLAVDSWGGAYVTGYSYSAGFPTTPGAFQSALPGKRVSPYIGAFVAKIIDDSTPPTISCGSADSLWHASDGTIACTASDSGSGLANPSDANFTLSTSLAVGTETANASTCSYQVCDKAGNCATAGPIASNKVDKKTPTVSISTPTATTYLLNQIVQAQYQCTDGGSGVASCSGTVANGAAINTSILGSQTFSVSATDNVGNGSNGSAGYSVAYAASGMCYGDIGHQILQPINADGTSVWKQGSTIPAKFRVCGANGVSAVPGFLPSSEWSL